MIRKLAFVRPALAAFAGLMLVASYPALAGDANISTDLPGVVGPSEVLNVGTSLALIVFTFLVVAWIYRRSQFQNFKNSSFIEILATQALGQKERVMLVEVAGKQLVLGVTASQIQTLYVLEKPLEREEKLTSGFGFAERLQTILKGEAR